MGSRGPNAEYMGQDWRWREKTHASGPSTSGKTYEKTSVIQTRPEQFDVFQEAVNRFSVTKACLKTWSTAASLSRTSFLSFKPAHGPAAEDSPGSYQQTASSGCWTRRPEIDDLFNESVLEVKLKHPLV